VTETTMRKRALTVDEQIAHMKAKGITFDLCPEDVARDYLTGHTYYFKLASYRKLFDKRIGGPRDGQYVNLDFGMLRDLASVDRTLRYALLPMTLDVEHFAKTKLMAKSVEHEGDDGYGVVSNYLASLSHSERARRLQEFRMLQGDVYSGDLVAKYQPDDMPLWAYLEVISFGTFIDLYRFCARRWNDDAMFDEHYMLRQAKAVRNACAHSSNVINGFKGEGGRVAANRAVYSAVAEAGVSKRVRCRKMRNPRLQQIATLLYLHCQIVPEGTSKQTARQSLLDLSLQMDAVARETRNDTVKSSFSFLEQLIDKWY